MGDIACVRVFWRPGLDLPAQGPPLLGRQVTGGQPVGIKPDVARQGIGEIHAVGVHRHPAGQRGAFKEQGSRPGIARAIGKHPARPVQPVPDHRHRLRLAQKQRPCAVILRGQQRQFQPLDHRVGRNPRRRRQGRLRPGGGFGIATQAQRHQGPPVQNPQRGQQSGHNQPLVTPRVKDDEIRGHLLPYGPALTGPHTKALIKRQGGACPLRVCR